MCGCRYQPWGRQKLLISGNFHSALDRQYMAAEFIRFLIKDRPRIAAILDLANSILIGGIFSDVDAVHEEGVARTFLIEQELGAEFASDIKTAGRFPDLLVFARSLAGVQQ